MGHPNLRVEFKRALKTGANSLYTCTRAPPVFERVGIIELDTLTELWRPFWTQIMVYIAHT